MSKNHRKMNWNIFSYRYTGDDMVIFTDGNRWIAFDSIGRAAVNDLSDGALYLTYTEVKYSPGAFDGMFSGAMVSSVVPCGYNFCSEFDRDHLSHICLICEGVEY